MTIFTELKTKQKTLNVLWNHHKILYSQSNLLAKQEGTLYSLTLKLASKLYLSNQHEFA